MIKKITLILSLLVLGACNDSTTPVVNKPECNSSNKKEQYLTGKFTRARLLPYYQNSRNFVAKTPDSKVFYIEYNSDYCDEYSVLEILQ